MRFAATQDKVRVIGRSLYEGDTRYLGFSGSSVSFTFVGKKAEACVWSNKDDFGDDLWCYLAVYIDGEKTPSKRICLDRTENVYTLYEAAEERQVTVTIMKYSEAAFGRCGIRYLEIDSDKLCPPPTHGKRRMEIIGDSITCGYGVESSCETDIFRTETENPTKSYSLLTAQALQAEAQLVSWSGNGIISGYVEEDAMQPSDKWLMPEVYQYTDIATSEKLHGDDESKWERWDFTGFVPDIILVNLGTNDCSWCKDIQERKDHYRDMYVKFLQYIRANNPKAQILCMLGTMDQRVLKELEEAVEIFGKQQNDPAVHFLSLPPQNPKDGYGADFHPSPYTQEKTAELVTAKVREIMNW